MSESKYDANSLFEAGGIFLFFDVPLNSEFGIDYNCWRTGENFKGVKMIPPGIHFIYFSVADKYGNIGLRNGFFHDFKVKQVVAKKWNKSTEIIEDSNLNEDQLENFNSNKREFDRFLGAYPYEEYKRWISLTNNMNFEFISRLLPTNKIISSEACLIGEKFLKSRSSISMETNEAKPDETERFKVPSNLQEAENRLPKMQNEKIRALNFPKYHKNRFRLEVFQKT